MEEEEHAVEEGSDNSMVDEICSEAKDAGSCDGTAAEEERFYYDIITEDCQPFTFSGCGGNNNNFLSLTECRTFCGLPHTGH